MIIFYSMGNRCGFCKKAMEDLVKEIETGLVVVKNSSEAPSNVSGFPYFEIQNNGKTHTGYLEKKKLFKKLDIDFESYIFKNKS